MAESLDLFQKNFIDKKKAKKTYCKSVSKAIKGQKSNDSFKVRHFDTFDKTNDFKGHSVKSVKLSKNDISQFLFLKSFLIDSLSNINTSNNSEYSKILNFDSDRFSYELKFEFKKYKRK